MTARHAHAHANLIIIIINRDSIVTLELTVCHESNLIKSKEYKTLKYQNIAQNCTNKSKGKLIKNFTLEVSSLGLMSPSLSFTKCLGLSPIPPSLKERIIRETVNNSFKIYCKRNSL